MPDRLKRAAAWLGLVTDDRYPDYDDTEPTEGVSRDELLAEAEKYEPNKLKADRYRSDQHRSVESRPVEHRPVEHRTAEYAAEKYDNPAPAPVTGRQAEPAKVTALETRRPPLRSAPSTGGTATATALAVEERPVEVERADLSRIVTVHPRSFNDARTIGEHFRDGVPVIMNLSQMENADAKRLVDFAAGLILGLRGNIERVTSKVFLLSPQNVAVAAEDKERIAGGFFNQS